MADTGFVVCGTGSSIAGPATQESSPAWATPANIQVEAETPTVLFADTDMRDDPGTNSEYLRASNFTFGIPAGATIDGIEVRHITRGSSEAPGAGNRYVATKSVRLVDQTGTVVGNDRTDDADWPINTSPETVTYGGVADLWGITPSRDDVSDADFGCVVAVIFPADADRGQGDIDAVAMRITYTAAGGGGIEVLRRRLEGHV